MNNNISEYESRIESLYDKYMRDNNIDKYTGILGNTNRKLATLPFIGSRYGENKKILFIGMDIGSDERAGISNITQRRNDIENKKLEKHNPHIAGTYFLSMYFLKDNSEYSEIWNKISEYNITCQKILKGHKKELGLENTFNCLSYVSLTNYYKYVTLERVYRSGNLDRQSINEANESKLLQNEIEILKPDIIFMQSKSFNNNSIKNTKDIDIYIGNHPSSREKGTRVPKNMINNFIRIKK